MANEGRSNSSMAFIVGGLVVAVGVMAYFVFGDGETNVSGGGDSTTVNVETSSGSEGGGADAPATAESGGDTGGATKN